MDGACIRISPSKSHPWVTPMALEKEERGQSSSLLERWNMFQHDRKGQASAVLGVLHRHLTEKARKGLRGTATEPWG